MRSAVAPRTAVIAARPRGRPVHRPTRRRRRRGPTGSRPGRARRSRPQRARRATSTRNASAAAIPTQQPARPSRQPLADRPAPTSAAPMIASDRTRASAEIPTELPARVSIGAPLSAHWTATTPIVPAAVRNQPTAARRSRSPSRPRAMTAATKATPTSATRPRYRSQRAITPGGEPLWLVPPAASEGAPVGGA